MARITGTLCAAQYTCLIISCSFFVRMRNVSDKSRRESQNTHFVFNNFFFCFEIRVVYEIRRGKYCRAGQATDNNMAHWRMCSACWIPKATDTHCRNV